MTLFITGPHLMRICFTWAIFYYTFSLIYHSKFSIQRKTLSYWALWLISITLNIFLSGYANLLIAIIIYFVFWSDKKIDYYLINIILLSFLVKFLAIIIPSPVLMHFFPNPDVVSYGFNLTINLIEFIFSITFVYFYNYFKLSDFFQSRENPMTSIVLGYVYIIFFMFLKLTQHFKAYAGLITGMFIFILIQCIFIILIFSFTRRRQRKVYRDRFSEEQVKNLKLYTDQLEHDQLKLRHFKHDYKNLLFSLKSVAEQQNYELMNQALDNLENYSDDYLNNLSMDLYQDLNNVKNPYLKSLLISKLNTINQKNIVCFFNCTDELNNLPINIFDLIRLLDRAIDNAIHFTERQEHGKIQLAITQENNQLAFLINNTLANLPTTEREQDYLELLHIKELKKKYSNIFIQHSKNAKWFRFHITLITKEDKKWVTQLSCVRIIKFNYNN